ncbi:MAG: glycosyltransferase family 2 protein [Flavobacterium sp.]
MITLVLTNRNRDLRIVKNCLQSLKEQTHTDFKVFLVDYGSDTAYQLQLVQLLEEYPQIQYIDCPVQGQLWHKCRAINMALQQTTTPYFIVGDIDLIFASGFIAKATELAKSDEVHYFQYGFLSQQESLLNKDFNSCQIAFKGNEEVTGTTLFPTLALKALHGYDEFYHGWGAEDTDIHIRMKNAGLKVIFYDKEILLKHQWHPKVYRSKQSTHPFHSQLERINHAYMLQTHNTQRTVVNQNQDWGKVPLLSDYEKLTKVDYVLKLKATILEINAVLAQMANFTNEVIAIEITAVSRMEKIKNQIKKIIGKKYLPVYNMDTVNNLLLETIIKQYRNNPYSYSFDRQKNVIQLKMYFQQ